jgi:hypothetical protein
MFATIGDQSSTLMSLVLEVTLAEMLQLNHAQIISCIPFTYFQQVGNIHPLHQPYFHMQACEV